MDRSAKLENKEEELAVPDAGNAGTVECFERGRVESQGEETESEVTYSISERSNYLQIPYGFQSRGSYKHASKNCEIVGVTHNSRFRQFVFLDSRGITSWSYESVYNTVTRHLNYPSYQFNVLRLIIFSRKFNVYFALSKEYALKVFNLNFHEVFSVAAEMHSVLCMVFNHVKDELITGGTGGMKFWTFGELDKNRQKALDRDSRPMANYGLVLRASYPDMGGSWVKQVELDEAMQRLYCLSERNVVAYDMEGNLLFQILDAHRGPVTGCVYSKACNFLVTVGTDCDVNVWSRAKSGGKVHTFSGHSKAITKILLHPENSALVITAAMDGIIKVNSLDFMEEIYSIPVFSEGIYWMNIVSSKLLYCCSNRFIEVFSLNHLCDFWASSRCSVTSLSLVTCKGKSTRVMAVGNDSSVRLISRKRQNLSTVLPPPSISPLNMLKDVAYNREFNMMYLLIDEQEIWVYYTRTNPATRVESWKLDFIEDIHNQHSQDALQRSRANSPWPNEGNRSPSPESPPPGRSSFPPLEVSGRESMLSTRKEKVQITCLGILYSPIIMTSLEGNACPDTTHFLMAGTQDGRVLFLHMFWQGLKYHQLQANKDAVLQVYHDQDNNTLVTKCRYPKIVIHIWSLPLLQLMRRIDCDADMTCFTRMNNILLCGHQSGYLHLHSLSVDNNEFREDQEERAKGTRRSPPKDHKSCINSVDSNSNLEIFCSVSGDGIIKIWDKNKTLLREIIMNETLTVASFLNTQGDILIGFKQHIFIIPNEKVYPVKDGLLPGSRSESIDDEAFETESDIYEDPSVRFESKKILQPDPTNMENYLVPFPNLQLKTSWFMEGRPPPDLEPQNQQEEEESISLMSDSLSLAPTEVYGSPSSTPRRISLASSVAMSERRTSTELWDLPEFGNSPVSSPPRTPPPEPTPPPTPPPEVESDEDSSGGEEKKEPQKSDEEPCERCEDVNKEGKKKVPVISSFRREKGRMGNITIDSKSLRSGFGGPGYAAPVARKLIEQRPEPKSFKPRRIPRPIAKKAKKPKDKGEEEATKEIQEKETEKIVNESGEAEEEKQRSEDTIKVNDDDDGDGDDVLVTHRMPSVVTMPTGEHKPFIRQDTVSSRQVPDQMSSRSAKNKEQMPEREKAEDAKEPQMTTSYSPSQRTAEENTTTALLSDENQTADNKDENTLNEDYEAKGKEENEEEAPVEDDKPERRDSPEPSDPQLVTFIDPDTGEVIQKPLNEVPIDAEILEDYDDDDDELEGMDEHTSAQAEDPTSSCRSTRSDRVQKSVTFSEDHIRTSRRNRQFPSLYTSGRDSPTLRSHNAGLVFKETVLPVYGNKRAGDPLRKTSKSSSGVSPLTIFALAKSRREHTPTSSNVRTRSADGRYRQKHGTTDNSSLRTDEVNQGDFDLNDEDLARLIDTISLQTGAGGHETPGSSRPPSVRKQGSTLMRWCIQALQKPDREVLFPPKPTRPSSSPSVATSKATKKAEETPKGNILYLNKNDSEKRPQTADTVRSNATSQEEHSMFPYENTPSRSKGKKQTKTRKSATPARRNTWKRVSSDEDEDFLDAYQAMRSSIGIHDADKDYMKDLLSGESFERERLSNSRDIPSLDTTDYGGNWQNKVLERAYRLKQQRLERQKSANERRQALDHKQKKRWKNSSLLECGQEQPPKSGPVLEFITPPLLDDRDTSPSPSPLPSLSQTEIWKLKEQELSNERPFRLRLNSQPGGVQLTPLAKRLMDLKTCDHDVSDVANVLPKPPPSASIPSKCSRYVLVAQPEIKQPRTQATAVEETLLMLRFPKSRVRRRHNSATIPGLHANRNVRARTIFEM